MWPLLLQQCGGHLPTDEATLFALQHQIRHQAHLTEHITVGQNTLREGMNEHAGRSYYFGDGSEMAPNTWQALEKAMGNPTKASTTRRMTRTAIQTWTIPHSRQTKCLSTTAKTPILMFLKINICMRSDDIEGSRVRDLDDYDFHAGTGLCL